MGGPISWKRWTALAAATVVAVLAVDLATPLSSLVKGWADQRRNEAFWKRETRTNARPLAATRRLPQALSLFRDPVADGFRWLAVPSFSGWYTVSLQPQAGGDAIGQFSYTPLRAPPPPGSHLTRTFHIPRPAYSVLTGRIDSLARGWGGDARSCMDGTLVVFELAKGGRALSGSGNAGCSAHYKALSSVVLDAVRRFAPDPVVPDNPEWEGPDSK